MLDRNRNPAGRSGEGRSSELDRVPSTAATDKGATASAELEGGSNGSDCSLLYGFCHDLGGPLRDLVGHLEFLEDALGGRLGDEARQHLEFSRESAEQAQALLASLRTHARVDLGEGSKEPSDVDSLLDEALANLEDRIEDAGARVTRATLPVLHVNPGEIVLLFQNLVENAIKYRGEDAPRVHVSHARLADGDRFSVSDNGIGLPSEDGIFEPFERGDRDNGREGSGMGLALCKRVVENHGGQIWATDDPRGGSTFRFTLDPATPPESAPA